MKITGIPVLTINAIKEVIKRFCSEIDTDDSVIQYLLFIQLVKHKSMSDFTKFSEFFFYNSSIHF